MSKNKKVENYFDYSIDRNKKKVGKKQDDNIYKEIKLEDSKDIFELKKKLILNVNQSRKNELHNLLLSSVSKNINIKKIKFSNVLHDIPVLSMFFCYDLEKKENSCCNSFFISNDTLIILTKYLDNAKSIKFSHLNQIFELKKNSNQFDFYNFIIENDEFTNKISIIKLINNEFSFKYFYEIDTELDFSSEEKYLIDDIKEESIGININETERITNYNPGTSIIIKKNNKHYLIGIIDEGNHYHIFNRDELLDIKNKLNIIDMKYKFCQIEKLDFTNKSIKNKDLVFIFQYNFINLVYLNLENNKITSDGLVGLQNESLAELKYLNLSNNKINDKGLLYLNYLYKLKELILLNMNLSDDYFLYLEKTNFINTINIIECEKENLIVENIYENYKDFKLPNLKSLRVLNKSKKLEINYNLKKLFSCDNICSILYHLDLSNTNLKDNGMLRLKKNITKCKIIKSINLEGNSLTYKSKKYLDYFKNLKIQLLLDEKELVIKTKNVYNILLGGSTISGKTSYSMAYSKSFTLSTLTTMSIDSIIIRPNFNENIKAKLYDIPRWNGRYNSIIINFLSIQDGVILLIDVTERNELLELEKCKNLIDKYYEIEDFPVLLIVNKIDLERKIEKEEIEKIQKDNEFIGYFEVSCKDNINVKESIEFMVDYIFKKEKKDYDIN